MEGVDGTCLFRGCQCGAIRKYSDALLIFLLKAARPEKYRESWRRSVSASLDNGQSGKIIIEARAITGRDEEE